MSDGEPLLISDERHPNPYDTWEDKIRPIVAEFVGVTVFVFVGTMAVQTNDITSIGLAHGLMIALLIMGLGNIRPVLAEFVGVTVFVFVGTVVVQTNDIVSIGLAHGLMIALLIIGIGNISNISFKNENFEKVFRPVLAEFVGVTVFVFVGTMVVQTNDIVSIGLAHGLMIALLIMGLGNISGGHFNPAVTLGVALNGGISISLSVLYFFAQMIGGALGAAFTRAVLPSHVYHGDMSINGGAHTLSAGVEPGWAVLCEAILTFVLVFTVLMNALDKRNQDSVLTPLAIGFAVAVDIMGGGMTTGASMNPARSFGPALAVSTFNDDVWKHHYVYWVGPALGSLVAAGIYRFLFRR